MNPSHVPAKLNQVERTSQYHTDNISFFSPIPLFTPRPLIDILTSYLCNKCSSHNVMHWNKSCRKVRKLTEGWRTLWNLLEFCNNLTKWHLTLFMGSSNNLEDIQEHSRMSEKLIELSRMYRNCALLSIRKELLSFSLAITNQLLGHYKSLACSCWNMTHPETQHSLLMLGIALPPFLCSLYKPPCSRHKNQHSLTFL